MTIFLLLFLIIISSSGFYHVSADSELNPGQVQRMFIANEVYHDIQGIMGKAWERLKSADADGTLTTVEFEKDVLWNEIILGSFRPQYEELKLIDQVIEDHYPSKYLNQIVNLLELQALEAASEHKRTTPDMPLLDFWKEAWVTLSSILIQLHYHHDWIFDHAYAEHFPDNLDHDVDDDFYTLRNDQTRFFYTWLKINEPERGADQNMHNLAELADSVKMVIQNGKNDDAEFPKNLFVGLRMLLNMHPEIVGPYKELEKYRDQARCLGGQEYVGIQGLSYEIPVYVLLYILSAEMKYYLLRNIGEMQKCIRGKCNFQMGPELDKHLKVHYDFYYNEMVKAFKIDDDPVKNAPPEAWTWRCDPPEKEGKRNYVEGVNFDRFYDFDTSFMIEERNLSNTQTCRDTCDMFDGSFSSIPCEAEEWQCLESDDDFDCWERAKLDLPCPAPQRTICPNSGLSCTTTRIKNAKVCRGETENRYIEFMQSDGKMYQQLGEKKSCKTRMQKMRSAQISERSAITKYEPQQCEVCLCKCYEPLGKKSHRYISVLPHMSDISDNRVVVGVRFIKIDDQIHLQIAEAATTGLGLVDNTTIRWIENHDSVDKANFSQVFRLGRESKKILLDDVISPPGYAITGVRLKPIHIPVDRYFETELVLQLHVTAMQETGELDPSDSGWVFNFNDSRFRTEVGLEDLDHPMNAAGASQPVSGTNQFLQVQGSSLKKDAGQTPVPFFDTQEVIFGLENILRGISLYYKTTEGFGGFLGFRLISDVQMDLPSDPRFNLWHFIQTEDRIIQGSGGSTVRPLPPVLKYKPRPPFRPPLETNLNLKPTGNTAAKNSKPTTANVSQSDFNNNQNSETRGTLNINVTSESQSQTNANQASGQPEKNQTTENRHTETGLPPESRPDSNQSPATSANSIVNPEAQSDPTSQSNSNQKTKSESDAIQTTEPPESNQSSEQLEPHPTSEPSKQQETPEPSESNKTSEASKSNSNTESHDNSHVEEEAIAEAEK